MRTNFWGKVWLGFILATLLLLAGCASSGGGYQESGYGQTAISDVPSSFYGNNSTLEHWYTAPYWRPDAD
jgi:hypothetical protein